jgi:hypothetical protein
MPVVHLYDVACKLTAGHSSCRMVSTYLVHHGYCATAESFAHGTGQVFDEEITSIKNRQSKLI